MNARKRLKEAYENVSFSADETWTTSPNAFHKSNLELYLTEHHLQRKRLQGHRPRTVRECIPSSRLAHYANFVYNESREMSYSSSAGYADSIFAPTMPSEPWEMPEVGELYRWFLKNLNEDDFRKREERYESPLLNVNGFEDKILKIQITEDRVKNLWSNDNYQFCEGTKTGQLVLKFFTSPLTNFFLFYNCSYDHEWFRNISISRDFEQLEQLSKSFKDQNTTITKILTGTVESTSSEATSTEILYSEVLQGLSPSRKFMSLKPDAAVKIEPPSENFTVLNRPEEDNFVFNQSIPPPSKFVPPQNKPFQVETNARCKFPLPQARTVPFSPSYVPQTYVHPQVQTVQRWIPLNLANSYYQLQVFNQGWYTAPNPPVEANKIFGLPSVNKVSSDRNSCDVFRRNSPVEEIVQEAEDPLVTTSVSKELEIQALEQYSNSNENFYQELERQAQEQYTSSPE